MRWLRQRLPEEAATSNLRAAGIEMIIDRRIEVARDDGSALPALRVTNADPETAIIEGRFPEPRLWFSVPQGARLRVGWGQRDGYATTAAAVRSWRGEHTVQFTLAWPPNVTQRRRPRVPAVLRAALVVARAGEPPIETDTIDVSAGGVAVRRVGAAGPSVGEHVGVVVWLPDGPMHATATCVGERAEGMVASLRFDGLALADEARVRAFVDGASHQRTA